MLQVTETGYKIHTKPIASDMLDDFMRHYTICMLYMSLFMMQGKDTACKPVQYNWIVTE